MPPSKKGGGKGKASQASTPPPPPPLATTTTAAEDKVTSQGGATTGKPPSKESDDESDSAIGPVLPSSSTAAPTDPLPATAALPEPRTVLERTRARFAAARPYEARLIFGSRQPPPTLAEPEEPGPGLGGLKDLEPRERAAWLATRIAARIARRPALSATTTTGGAGAAELARVACGGGAKTVREAWKLVNEGSVPLRAAGEKQLLGAATAPTPASTGIARRRREGASSRGEPAPAGSLEARTIAAAEARWERRVRLACLLAESRCFRAQRERETRGVRDDRTGEPAVVTEREVVEDKRRRLEIAALRRDMAAHGSGPASRAAGKIASNPDWDDVVPVVLEEPAGALASIAYPADYAEAMSYLRAVMKANEHSERCLWLTEHIINMNASHYTVWLYRAAILFALEKPIAEEIEWLNEIALANLKNYQIWHHRHLLVENHFPSIAADPAAVAAFAASERRFLERILAEDTKNYHVWSYRSYLANKLGLFSDADELASVERMIDDDVRNNSAWSHRFFLVFSHPDRATPGAAATEPDPKAPPEMVDREVAYAQAKIRLAPQNQSPWSYLRGVLVKGGRKLGEAEGFAREFVTGLGKGEDEEDVTSTHALDLLADIYAEQGRKEEADLCLQRLGQKWDRIRLGYWEWRRRGLGTEAAAA
ncbi:hypothetical protein VTJ83DRAFT_5766 [Remersonia thermophila]|uniref:Protein farnesyltransferase/geranylgeranyltransferase type-1 subunit alpha n=1 Tax=Remersonia thermophila TaxID=72144 RepID=A0ABR4DA01_9PEZI